MKINVKPYGWLRQLVVVAASLLALACLASLASAQQIIAINSGGPAVSPFVADKDFSGGATINHANAINLSKVALPAPAAVYQSARIATATVRSFTYTIPGFTPGTNYVVRLHFAETFFATAGSRVFNVTINGTQVLTHFDILAASGGKNIANAQQFTEPANASGQFVITFTSVTNNALISGIEIDPVTIGTCTVPTAPSGLSATAVSASQINLSWIASASNCPVTYDVFRSTTSGFTPSSSNQIASGVSSTSFSNTGLVALTTYFYVVKGVGPSGTSAASNQASVTTPGITPPPPPGSKLFAPYNDMSLTVSEGIVATAQNAGLKSITLAFLINEGGCSYGWGGLGGTLPADSLANGTTVQSVVHQMQANGVNVIISFGGAQGATVGACNNAGALQASLQGVLSRYGVNMLDFDMEASDTLGGGAGLPVLDQALKGLKAANPNLVVSYTLPVLPTGLVFTGMDVLTQAHKDGFNPNVINVMAMDYGGSVDNGGQMGLDAIDAAQAVHGQIQQAGLSSSVGITVMIGHNDTQGEVFQLSDANTVLNFANANSYVTRLAFWSLARDNGGCAGQAFASPTCSGIAQNNLQFSHSFDPF
ncbi:MAG TPA: malectin domain-containing carbohydrate-binding protein [Terriglobales bacterium]|jgi:hypothetical protein|nr:malectin domain-containing carbohydrate-binding protein [Terriglobales bacterium]